jgi:hypothetical protein
MDLFGRPVRATPAGRNPVAYHLIDTPKAHEIRTEPLVRELDRVYRATGRKDILPSKPTSLTDPTTGRPVRFTDAQSARYVEIRGLLSHWALGAAIKSAGWPTMTVEQQAEMLSALNGRIETLSKVEMLKELGILRPY